MPADDRLWAENCNRAEDGREPTIEPNEQKAIGIVELRSLRYLSAKDVELLAIEAMRRRIEREFGPVDILVANAGGSFTTPGPIEQTSEEEWRASIDGNLTATFLTIKSFLPRMKERRTGSIITMSSAAARRPYPMSPS